MSVILQMQYHFVEIRFMGKLWPLNHFIIRVDEIKHSDWLRVSHKVYFNQP